MQICFSCYVKYAGLSVTSQTPYDGAGRHVYTSLNIINDRGGWLMTNGATYAPKVQSVVLQFESLFLLFGKHTIYSQKCADIHLMYEF